MPFKDEVQTIQEVITLYFEGVFYGNIEKLTTAFHPQCLLIGDINGQPYFKSLPGYLEGVKSRKSPNDRGENFNMRILAIEQQNDVAVAKLHVPMLGFNYYDYVSLGRVEGRWQIVNKVFTNVALP